MANVRTITGDCLEALDDLPREGFELIYLDPPFFTQKQHSLSSRRDNTTFVFNDVWNSHDEYARFLHIRISKLYRALSKTGSLFFHCDKRSVHVARVLLDRVFGCEMFQSEIIWSYKRWSNSAKGLLPAHQNILFYAKSPAFKFNPSFGDYSETTNLDQILQKRMRDGRNKVVYARDGAGGVIPNGPKKGVPLSDVWELPYLNPKANERAGYPTQKPILLLERIISLCTDAGDNVLDPFCGSGTTLIAAKILGRNAVGIDISEEAIALTNERLGDMVKTESEVLRRGRRAYRRHDTDTIRHLDGLDCFVVPRNKGIDAILRQEVNGAPVFVRVQRPGESVDRAAAALCAAAASKGPSCLIVIITDQVGSSSAANLFPNVCFVQSTALAVKSSLTRLSTQDGSCSASARPITVGEPGVNLVDLQMSFT